jgi:hypothetical protein
MTDITSMQPKTMTHEQILVMASVLIAMWIMLVFGQKITSFVIQLLFGSKKQEHGKGSDDIMKINTKYRDLVTREEHLLTEIEECANFKNLQDFI